MNIRRWNQNPDTGGKREPLQPPKCPYCGRLLNEIEHRGAGSYTAFVNCWRSDTWDGDEGLYYQGEVDYEEYDSDNLEYDLDRIICPYCERDISQVVCDLLE